MGWGEPQTPVRPIEVAAYDHLEQVTAQRDTLAAAVKFVAEGMCVTGGSTGCDPASEDGLCEVCTCHHAQEAATAIGELGTPPTTFRYLVIDHGSVPTGWCQETGGVQIALDDTVAEAIASGMTSENFLMLRSNHRVEVIDLTEALAGRELDHA